MADKTWKAFERRVAKRLRGRRIEHTGERAGVDVNAPPFCYQVKLGRRMPAYLREWLDGIATARATQIGAVVWKPLYARDEDAVVVLRLKDWQDLHGC